MSHARIVGLSGSLSATSRTRILLAQIIDRIQAGSAASAQIIDVGAFGPALGPLRSRDQASPALEAAFRAVETADLLVVASPTYKGSYSGLFKHFIDFIDYKALVGRPVGLVATGGSDRHGLWRRDDTAQVRFNELATWVEVAKIAERGRFDALFLADIIGTDAAYKGSWDNFLTEAVQIPINDSFTLAAALIGATENLGLTFTSSILQAHPFDFARKVSTLDHLSKGRVGWNIVTSVSHNAAQNFGFDRIVPHDERYHWAHEYVDVVYKLWEGSWDEDALVEDRQRNFYADPSKVHRIHHESERYKVLGPHLTTSSPQRTPVLFQAGSSRAGRAFAAKNAEGTFIVSKNPEGPRRLVTEVRGQVRAAGRDPHDLLFIQGMAFVVGSTEEEARRKARDLAGAYALNAQIVSTPERIADQLEQWRDAGIDGVNVIYHTLPGSFADFADHVMPVLRQRGLAQQDHAPGTYRERLFQGRGPRINVRHPAARYRGAFTPTRAAA